MARPTKYKKKYCEELIALMTDGLLDVQICAKWGISKDTFYRWMKDYPEFKESHNIGLCACESAWIEKGLHKAVDFKYWIALMNKKFNYSGTQGNDSKTINIGNMNVLSMSQDEINTKLANLMDKYGTTSLEELKQKVLEHNERSG